MKLITTLGAFLLSGIVAASPVHNIVIFGDSLSDNGNLYEFIKHQLPSSPPYYEGRFSNGPVWIEHLAASYFPEAASGHLLNYAIGGAGVSEEEDDALFSLKGEINTYLTTHQNKASADSLFVVWIGANNYLGLPDDVDKTVKEVNLGITHSLQRLVDAGAKHILLLNLPDLGSTPAALEFDIVETLSEFTQKHNLALNKTFSQFKQEFPEVDWIYFDINQSFAGVINHAADYGFTNTTRGCVDSLLSHMKKPSILNMVSNVTHSAAPDACAHYLFFDLVHPTANAHRMMAEKARELLDASGLEVTS